MDISEIKSKFHEIMILPDDRIIDVMLGLLIANLADIDSINLYVIGPPSSGKTELIRSLNKVPQVEDISSISPKAFISGFGGKTIAKESSYLFQLQNSGKRLMTIKDFTGMLTSKADGRMEVLEQIREIADGYFSRAIGNQCVIKWEGKLAFLAGVTGVIDSHHSVIQKLGERFLYWRIPEIPNDSVSKIARSMSGNMPEVRKDIQLAVVEFLHQYDILSFPVNMSWQDGLADKLDLLLNIITIGRSTVSRNPYTHVIEYRPEREVSGRVSKQLHNLATGIAVINNKVQIDKSIYLIMAKIALDSMHSIRAQVLKYLWDTHTYRGAKKSIWTIADSLRFPESTVRMHIEDMVMIGMVHRNMAGNMNEYSISDYWYDLILEAELYSNIADNWK